jgi:NAD(P)H-flavin reductase
MIMEEIKYNPEAVKPDPMVPAIYRVESFVNETADTFTVTLSPSGTTVADWVANQKQLDAAPGQFNMLYVFGMGEVPVSISAGADKNRLLTHTTRAVGAITKAMSVLNVGDMVGVRGPFGSSWPVAGAKGKDVVLVAGGIGLAPLRPVILALLARRSDFGRVVILYGARTPKDIIFSEDLKAWKKQPGVDLYITVDRGTKAWRGSVGVVTRLIPQIIFDPANTVAMLCGPEIMMHFTIDALQKRGLSGNSIYVSMERNMKCAVGLCGHCQFGQHFICKDGPVFTYDKIAGLLRKPEI